MSVFKKAELVKQLATKLGQKEALTSKFVTEYGNLLAETVKSGKTYRFSGVGTFSRKVKGASTARNPRTGDKIKVPKKYWPAFSFSSTLKKDVSSVSVK
uniref:Uncharacterized protein n=1 Tax=Chromera velia CCMP2878 TaxID=1169474 RepID=A0A0G4HQI7_9ALVE|eukprot:Cvel_30319.t1-p1 / transcript=Cvel_30319.t1 / gene=Cvel_30319 / organism=Chromera_velia_CCMP2878 / gene_product=DNA-binding protein HU, putative / transcript_product=DNA-binding protein HU, putative / location=Cvel_scaffold4303:6138-8374(-) / protein_length=98 / sequence_SO=supercontig / SO=protein_coding / is_pseudo=false